MRDARLLKLAKWMRSNPTPAEARLWYQLRAKRFESWKFRHQTVLAPYIADFTCRSAMLLVEVDGDTHALTVEDDVRRTAYLEGLGWRVLRFTNADVMGNIEGVLITLSAALPLSRPRLWLGHPHQVNSARRCLGPAGGRTDLMRP